MSWDRNNLAPHALPSILCDSLSPSSAGLNLGRHLGRFGVFPMVAGNGPNTSIGQQNVLRAGVDLAWLEPESA